jgi:F0F1-type ATP synthase delta subunit
MESSYAHALLEVIQKGMDPKKAVESLKDMLHRQGRLELLPRVARALLRIDERERATRPRVYVADQSHARRAFAESGVSEADVCVDETLIGGWRLEDGERLIDNSFKKHLLSIYSAITH